MRTTLRTRMTTVPFCSILEAAKKMKRLLVLSFLPTALSVTLRFLPARPLEFSLAICTCLIAKEFPSQVFWSCSPRWLPVILRQRDDIIQFQSVVQNQFCSPPFVNIIKYAFIKVRPSRRMPRDILTPVEYGFESENSITDCSKCTSFSFQKFAWCTLNFCFKCHFGQYYYCEEYIQ